MGDDFPTSVASLPFSEAARVHRFLAAVAANKVRGEVRRRLHQQKHNVNRESPLDEEENYVAESVPTPSQVAIAREKWFSILENQPAHYQEVVKLRYLGNSAREIAGQLGLDEGSVRRILRRIFRGATQ